MIISMVAMNAMITQDQIRFHCTQTLDTLTWSAINLYTAKILSHKSTLS